MKILYSIILTLILLHPCRSQTNEQRLEEIFTNSYRSPIISKGDNIPDFDRRKDNIDRFLVSLSYGIPPEMFMKKAGWTQEDLNSKVSFLTSKGWIKADGKRLYPTVFVVSGETGNRLYDYAQPVSEAIAVSIEKAVPSIKTRFNKAGFPAKYSFEDLSFLILSDVLLDNWQIMNMESDFLKQENRPERHGKFYYAAIMEYSGKDYEPFKIYGNQSGRLNDTTWLNIYGNNRIVANSKLMNQQFRDSVIANCLHATPGVYSFFEDIAADYKPELLSILEKNRSYSYNVFKKTGYSGQIRFEEFFIWWYHFIYTEATNILASKKIIRIPPSGNFYYF
jgi:hypothetical protein